MSICYSFHTTRHTLLSIHLILWQFDKTYRIMVQQCAYFGTATPFSRQCLPIAFPPSYCVFAHKCMACRLRRQPALPHTSSQRQITFFCRPLQKHWHSIAWVVSILYFETWKTPPRMPFYLTFAAQKLCVVSNEYYLAACQNDENLWMFIFASRIDATIIRNSKEKRTYLRWIIIPLHSRTEFRKKKNWNEKQTTFNSE